MKLTIFGGGGGGGGGKMVIWELLLYLKNGSADFHQTYVTF